MGDWHVADDGLLERVRCDQMRLVERLGRSLFELLHIYILLCAHILRGYERAIQVRHAYHLIITARLAVSRRRSAALLEWIRESQIRIVLVLLL